MGFFKKIKDFVRKDSPGINDNDWDKITISKNGKTENENHIEYNDTIVSISFPVKPKFSYQKNLYGNDYVYKYEAKFAEQNFGLIFEKHYVWAEYYGSVEYGCIETISYEEILEKIRKNPYSFLESCLKNYTYKLIEKSNDSLKIDNFEYVIKRRFSHHKLNVLEYFSDGINLFNGDSFIKGQLVLFGGDMLLSHLYVTSKTKATFVENYYKVFVNSFRCHLGIKDYILGKGNIFKRKTKNLNKKMGKFISGFIKK